MLPNDFPAWAAVYQQFRRWSEVGCFEALINDMRPVIHLANGHQGQPSAVVLDGCTLQSTCESGPRACYDDYKRRKGSKVHMAVDTLGHLIDLTVTPANEQERLQVKPLCEAVQHCTGETVEIACADQGYTCQRRRNTSPPGVLRIFWTVLSPKAQAFTVFDRAERTQG